jgi:hypothetical protein
MSLEHFLKLNSFEKSKVRHEHFVRELDYHLSLYTTKLQVGTKLFLFDMRYAKKVCKDLPKDFRDSNKESLDHLLSLPHDVKPESLWRALCSLKTKDLEHVSSLFGTSVQGFRVCFIENWPRFKHALGLSDAISLSLENLGIHIPFHMRAERTLDSSKPSKKAWYNKGIYPKHTKSGVQLVYRVLHRVTTKNRYLLLVHFLKVFPNFEEDEKKYIKMLKLSLVGKFAEQAQQELPEDYKEKSINLFPVYTQGVLDKIFRSNRKAKIQFYFNLLQSKSICAEVGDDMVLDALKKHKASLCRPCEDLLIVSDENLKGLNKLGSEFGQIVRDLYDPFTTVLPNTRACVEAGRDDGGNKGALTETSQLQQYTEHPLIHLQSNLAQTRLEPFVIGLFGPPGSGKTTLVSQLVKFLTHKLHLTGIAREKVMYSRSCSVKHWDGYDNQPIVVLDDLGQDLLDRQDISEFEILVSINDYILPMAELKEKGKFFRSPIIITTSNMQFGSTYIKNGTNSDCIEEPAAFWRRFDLPLLITKENGYRSIRKMTYNHMRTYEQLSYYHSKHVLDNPCMNCSTQFSGRSTTIENLNSLDHNDEIVGLEYPTQKLTRQNNGKSLLGRNFTPYEIMEECLIMINHKFDYHNYHFCDYWSQRISALNVDFKQTSQCFYHVSCYDDPNSLMKGTKNTRILFPTKPPAKRPICRVVPLKEPLKVRIITAGEKDTKVLQPFQSAMWTALGHYEEFCLTNGVKELEDYREETLPWINRIESKIQKILQESKERERLTGVPEYWLSGDYTAATDNFPMSCTNALIEGILSHITHQPTKDYVRWEISPHELLYPMNIGPGNQTSGQLMGSLLSFPLLCLLNVHTLRTSGFSPGSFLVNGDDVVARGTLEQIDRWRKFAPTIGLELSLGKNFIDPEFCTVNSQLFYEGEHMPTGKLSTQTRSNCTLSYCFAESQFYYGASQTMREIFVKRNYRGLRKTPRSLLLSKDFGGLGYRNTIDIFPDERYDMKLMKKVHLYDLLSKFGKTEKILGTEFHFVPYPVYLSHVSSVDMINNHGISDLSTQRDRIKSLEIKEQVVEEKFDDLSHSSLYRFYSSFKDDKPFRTLFNSIIEQGTFHILSAPSRQDFGVGYICVHRSQAKKLASELRQIHLENIKEIWFKSSEREQVDKDLFLPVLNALDLYAEYTAENQETELSLLFKEEGEPDNSLYDDLIDKDVAIEERYSTLGNIEAVNEFLSNFTNLKLECVSEESRLSGNEL